MALIDPKQRQQQQHKMARCLFMKPAARYHGNRFCVVGIDIVIQLYITFGAVARFTSTVIPDHDTLPR